MTGLGKLVRLNLRRDRMMILGWLAALVLTTASSARATIDLYPEPGARLEAAHAVNSNAALVAMYGPIFDESSLGAIAMFKLILMFGALMTIFFVVLVRRHTRQDEESGRSELVAATGTGPAAQLSAAVLVPTVLALILGLAVAGGNIAAGLPTAGSFAFGLAWTGLAWFAIALTAVCAQLFSSARTVAGVSAVVIITAYLVRAAGDLTEAEWLVWLSPFGWASRMRPYAGEQWAPLGLFIALWLLGVIGAAWLRKRRDLGSGLIPARPGAAHGTMRGVLALLARLHRPGLLGWAIGLASLGILLGAIAPSAASFAGSPEVEDMLRRAGGGGLLMNAFLALETWFMAIAVSAYGVSVMNRAHTEERSGHTEMVLAGGVSRTRLVLSTIGLAMVSTAVLMAVFGAAAGLAFGIAEHDVPGKLASLTAAGLGQLPAVWAIVGLTALAFGIKGSWAPLGWILLGASVVLGQLGQLLGLPQWLVKSSPFAHTQRMPVQRFEFDAGVIGLLVVSAVSVAAAWWCYRRRDLTGA